MSLDLICLLIFVGGMSLAVFVPERVISVIAAIAGIAYVVIELIKVIR